MDPKEIKTKGPLTHLTGHITGQQQYRTFHSKSKEKLVTGKLSCSNHRCSKVPKIARMPIRFNQNNKNTVRLAESVEDSGDNKAGPSKLQRNITLVKPKPSHIPRRKTTLKETLAKESPPKKEYQFSGDSVKTRNVQRVQLLINQEFRPEDRVPAASVATTRPIPTLGQFYPHNNVIDTDRMNDWFVELDTPANSMASNFFNMSSRLGDTRATAPNNEYIATNKYRTTTVSNVAFDDTSYQPSPFRSTNDNVSNWLSTDVEYPTRDNESGYRSISPPPTLTPMDIKSKHSKCSFTPGRENISLDNEKQLSGRSSKASIQYSINNDSTAADLIEQPTIILTKMEATMNRKIDIPTNPEGDNKKFLKTGKDQSKNCQYPSNTVVESTQQMQHVTVPSYVECPSEIHQKTTDFEDMALPPSDSPNTLSSLAGTDMEIRDDLSSQFAMDHEDSLEDHYSVEWCHRCRDDKSNDYEDSTVIDSLICQYNDDLVEATLVKGSDADDIHHYRWKRLHGDVKRHCKKCDRYRRFPSTRYKLPRTLSALRRRMSLGINCRRRLNRVWKKTAERWAMWSAKSPQKFRKLRVMNYLQRAILWEDADVQTNVFVYRETGTGPNLKEQKSAAVSTMLNFGSSSAFNKNGSGTFTSASQNDTCKFRHTNLGPSMFPFFYNSKNKSLSKPRVQEIRYSIGRVNNPKASATRRETQKAENHAVTQTINSVHSHCKSEDNDKRKESDKLEIESENYIQICEVTMDDKLTGTEDMASPMKDNVTSTLIHLDSFRQLNWEPQNAHTQMFIVCNNAETDVKFPLSQAYAASVLTSISNDIVLQRNCETNTEMKSLQSMNVMTTPGILKSSATFSHIDTQVTPVQSLKKISTEIMTSKSFVEKNNSPSMDTSTEIDDRIENHCDFSNQVMPQRPSFMASVTKSTSTTAVEVKEAYAVMSCKEFNSTEVTTCNAQVKSSACLTSTYIQPCLCVQASHTESETNTDPKYFGNSTNKLKTYLNTGMLINTLVEDAVMQSRVRTSSTDTKSIGNENMFDIATCTNCELKGSLVQKEKARYPTRLSVDRNSLHQESINSNINQNRTDNFTQYSHTTNKAVERVDNTRLISVRMFKADETAAQTAPFSIDRDHADIGISTSPISIRKAHSNRNSSAQIDTSVVLSNDLDAEKWIKSCIEKGERQQLDIERSFNANKNTLTFDFDAKSPPYSKKSESRSVGSETPFIISQDLVNNVTTVASAITDMAMEKYEDLIPIRDTSEQEVVLLQHKVTSDEVVKKEVREMTLQASPECSEAVSSCPHKPESKFSIMLKLDNSIKSKCVITINFSKSKRGTECSKPIEKKSAYVFTSRCILPPPTPCGCEINDCGCLPGECLFIYGKPKCVVHCNNNYNDDSLKSYSYNHSRDYYPLLPHMPSDSMYKDNCDLHSIGVLTSYYATQAGQQQTSNVELLSPKVYEALYDAAKRICCESPKSENETKPSISRGVDAEIEAYLGGSEMRSATMVTSPVISPNVRSAAMITSQYRYNPIQKTDQFTQKDPILNMTTRTRNIFQEQIKEGNSNCTQTNWRKQDSRVLEIPTHDNDPDCVLENGVKTHLVASCRYYSSLLTKQLDKVRENLTKHLTPSTNTYDTTNVFTEVSTMKPSAFEECGCQTGKHRAFHRASKFNTSLTPAVSLTDICRHDKAHLKSVYYMLTAIEGRLRRFKANLD